MKLQNLIKKAELRLFRESTENESKLDKRFTGAHINPERSQGLRRKEKILEGKLKQILENRRLFK